MPLRARELRTDRVRALRARGGRERRVPGCGGLAKRGGDAVHHQTHTSAMDSGYQLSGTV